MIDLKRPIAFIDLETTNKGTDCRIVEIAIVKVHTDLSREEKCLRVNPIVEIHPDASAVHKIFDKDVAGCPTFTQIAGEIFAFINECDLGGYESNRFDKVVLYKEFAQAGINWEAEKIPMVDVGVIFKRQNSRTLYAAYKHYCNADLMGAHSALADTNATVDIFFKQLEVHPNLPQTVEALSLYSNYDMPTVDMDGFFSIDQDGDYVFNRGKHATEKAKNNRDYLKWMYTKGQFSNSVIRIVEHLLGLNQQ